MRIELAGKILKAFRNVATTFEIYYASGSSVKLYIVCFQNLEFFFVVSLCNMNVFLLRIFPYLEEGRECDFWCGCLNFVKYGAFLNSFYLDVKQIIRRLERINCKRARSKIYFTFNQTRFLCSSYINCRGLFNSQTILVDERYWYLIVLTPHLSDWGIPIFLKSVSLKVNLIANLWFELIYYDVTI